MEFIDTYDTVNKANGACVALYSTVSVARIVGCNVQSQGDTPVLVVV